MNKIIVNSTYFWQVLQKLDNFRLALNNEENKGYLDKTPVFINNNYPDGLNYE